jgi:hypothetical protein
MEPRIEDEAEADTDDAHADDGQTGADKLCGSCIHDDDP